MCVNNPALCTCAKCATIGIRIKNLGVEKILVQHTANGLENTVKAVAKICQSNKGIKVLRVKTLEVLKEQDYCPVGKYMVKRRGLDDFDRLEVYEEFELTKVFFSIPTTHRKFQDYLSLRH